MVYSLIPRYMLCLLRSWRKETESFLWRLLFLDKVWDYPKFSRFQCELLLSLMFVRLLRKVFLCQMQVPLRCRRMVNTIYKCHFSFLGPNIRDWSQSKSKGRHNHSFPELIISGRTQKWKRGLFYDFKILLVVVILAQVSLITHPIFIFKVCRSVTRSGKPWQNSAVTGA